MRRRFQRRARSGSDRRCQAPIPVVLAPGCVDMCNFGSRAFGSVKYSSRLLYEWNANVTLMRTNVEENRRIGELIAETANRCAGPAIVLLPLRGVSMLDSPGGPFWDPAADRRCFEAIRAGLKPGIPGDRIGLQHQRPDLCRSRNTDVSGTQRAGRRGGVRGWPAAGRVWCEEEI